jgi:hypothetical protein
MRKILLVIVSVLFLISGFSLVACQKKETTQVPATTEQGEKKAAETGGYGEKKAAETGGYGEKK